MRRINYLAMSLLASAALAFTGCSSEDVINGGTEKNEGNEYFMTMTIQTSSSQGKVGTRTVENNPIYGNTNESDVTSGTFIVTDANKNIVYSKVINRDEWQNSVVKWEEGQDGKTQLVIPVQYVSPNVTYNVYFLANTTNTTPWTATYTAATEFVGTYADAKKFVMFNQNDGDISADNYQVTFTEANKEQTNAATITAADGKNTTIKIERVVARIDQPTSTATEIKAYEPKAGETLSDAKKTAMADAIAKVKSVSLTGYALANLANKTNIMQQWNATSGLLMPEGTTFQHPTEGFGTSTKMDNVNWFKDIVTSSQSNPAVNYVFENNATAAPQNATTMYFEYTVKLKDNEGADCNDGTFYRFENKIYTSIAAIYAAFGTNTLPFGQTSDKTLAELKIVDGKITASQEELSTFRTNHKIEVFVGGKTYYKQTIRDLYYNGGTDYLVQRNSIYQLKVNNVYNVGADVPNGDPDDVNPYYYLDVDVTVNPWVLNERNVDLQ